MKNENPWLELTAALINIVFFVSLLLLPLAVIVALVVYIVR